MKTSGSDEVSSIDKHTLTRTEQDMDHHVLSTLSHNCGAAKFFTS